MKNEVNMETVATIEKDLRFVSGLIKQKGREILNHFPVTPPQFVAMQWLLEEGSMTIGELSKKMYLAFSTTTDLIARMEKNNLVKRVRDERDRRVVRVHLLDEGIRIIDEVIKKRQTYLQEILHDFSDEEIRTLQSNLRKLHDNMKLKKEQKK
ncbi:MarR family winged helix-turn-helix transcriptional regulator [Pallidibacillus thermolactis]|jgi:MarR family transcriptional regulator, organic hydroperoxide resistance regulator|uniref:MarR family winged helix-turn-helix transcriptional regulator n=1 Tax=Pallidibacillus thermolactis TaxID=251051 RepID=UPI0021D831D8|nr:MarR family transcriptional regulator [Pallidibacillus thermolactis]MCU9602793.1 MarR family transcriptional regulator [Pallidibacillus thermolactis subsp. kokeshiiformis]